MSVFYVHQDNKILIKGNTYPHKESIKKMGARFLGVEKAWWLPASEPNLKQVEAFCQSIDRPAAIKKPYHGKNNSLSEQQAPSSSQGLTISELVLAIDNQLKSAFPSAMWVLGEIQNLNFRQSICFLSLAEQKSNGKTATTTIGAKIWGERLRALTKKYGASALREGLQEGLNVRVLCQVQLYRDRGFINLEILDLDLTFTKGQLALAREQLLKELRQNGLDRKNKGRQLALFPLHIGLITATNSRAYSDFIDQLRAYQFPGQVSFFPAQMQGEDTPRQVVSGFKALEKINCDLIIITRGGGSSADLRWFDNKEIALSIAHCPIPVVAAIGHHDDVCIAEEICFMRQKTPTAAADYIITLLDQTRQRMIELATAINKTGDQLIALKQKFLQVVIDRFLTTAQSLGANHQDIWRQALLQLQRASNHKFSLKMEQLSKLSLDLNNLLMEKIQRHHLYHSQLANKLQSTTQQLCWQATSQQQQLADTLQGKCLKRISKDQMFLSEINQQLIALDPQSWLKKGWTRLESENGKIRSIQEIHVGNTLRARLTDGSLTLTVKDKSTTPSKE